MRMQTQPQPHILKTWDAEISRLRALLTQALELLVKATDLVGDGLTPELRQEALKLMVEVQAYARKYMC